MDIAVHISFYFVEERLPYITRVLENLSTVPHRLKVFIYSTRRFALLKPFPNLDIEILSSRFLRARGWEHSTLDSYLPFVLRQYLNPFYLTWKHRKQVEEIINQYDVQVYLEDDIGFCTRTLEYWLAFKDTCLAHDLNLGFLRYETDEKNQDYCTDLTKRPRRFIRLEGKPFLLNDVNPYCGFWIYDQNELRNFVGSRAWHYQLDTYGIREKSAVGWHGWNMKRYKGTVIPLEATERNSYAVHPDCKVHHFPNNYIGHPKFCTIEFPIELNI